MSVPSPAIRYYFDEHVIAAVAAYLRAHGISVLTAYEAGRAHRRIPDADQLAYASASGLVLVSNDTDFLNPRHVPQVATGQHAGVVYIDQTVSIGQQGRFLRFFAVTMSPESAASHVHYYFEIAPGTFPDD